MAVINTTPYDQVMTRTAPVMAGLRDQQMWEIDKAKTGKGADESVLASLREKQAPHWLVDIAAAQIGKAPGNREYYMSNSPMGMLYNYIMGGPTVMEAADGSVISDANWTGYWHQFITVLANDCQDRTFEILAALGPSRKAEALRIMPRITALEKGYRVEMADLMSRQRSMDEEAFEADMTDMRNRHTELLHNVDGDEHVKAAVAYFVAYSRVHKENAKSASYPWTCASVGLLSLLSEMGERTVPVAIRNVVGYVPTPTAIVSGGVVVGEEGEAVGVARVSDGEYGTFEHDGRYFVLAPNTRPVHVPATAKTEAVRFKILGFAVRGFSAVEVYERLAQAGGVAEIREVSGEDLPGRQLGFLIGGECIAMVEPTDLLQVIDLIDTQIQVNVATSDRPSYKTGSEIKERRSLILQATVAQSLVAKREILTQCNAKASYWTQAPKALDTFGIQRARFQWAPDALPHRMATKPGDMIAKVFLRVGNVDEILTIGLSADVKEHGKPELEIQGIISPSIANLPESLRDSAISSVLAYTNFKHAELRVRYRKAG